MMRIYKDVMGERGKVNAHGKRGDKFGARWISNPELGGHVLTPEFGRARQQRRWVAEHGATKKEKRFASGAPAHNVTIRWVVRWWGPKEQKPSVGRFEVGCK